MPRASIVLDFTTTPRTWKELHEAAAAEHMSVHAYVRACVTANLRKSEFRAVEFREIQLAPRTPDSDLGTMLELLAARRGVVSDLYRGGEPSPTLVREMRKVLTPQQHRRMCMVLFQGRSLEDIGAQEGTSKQAIHACVNRSIVKLRASAGFVLALCNLFPDAQLTPAMLEGAIAQKRRRRAAA